MKYLCFLLVISWGLLSSCSTALYESDNINKDLQKMGKVKFKRPNLPVLRDVDYQKQIAERKLTHEREEEEAKKFTNKKIYFALLLEQYHELKNYLPPNIAAVSAPEVGLCPQFHSNVVAFKERIIRDMRDLTIKGKSIKGNKKKKRYIVDGYPLKQRASMLAMADHKNQSGLFPEMALPLTPSNEYPTLQDIAPMSKDPERTFTNAYRLYLEKNFQELQELCEDGQSDNYYAFENLITLMKSKMNLDHTQRVEVIQSLMKGPLAANMALLSSLEAEYDSDIEELGQESSPYFREVLSRLNAPWFVTYLYEIKKKRRSL